MTREPLSFALLQYRRQLVDHIVSRNEEPLKDRFGTAWEFANGCGFHTLTHSRYDVLPAAVALTGATPIVQLLEPELQPLLRLAAMFHAIGGSCGDGAATAVGEMQRWPDFDADDHALVAHAIEGVRRADVRPAGYQAIALRIGSGLDADAAAALTPADLMAGILADADRSHLGLKYGLHRLLLQLIELQRDVQELPEVSDGRDVVLDPVVVQGLLLQAADTCERHEFVFAVSDELFPRREENARKIRTAVAQLAAGELTWAALVQEAGFDGSTL